MHCVHGKSGLCIKSGVQCYQDGLHRCDPNMSVEDFRRIVEEIKGKTFQCLDEKEVVLIKDNNGFIKSTYLKDTKIGDSIYTGNGNFAKIIEKKTDKKEVYDIELMYGKHIFATSEHKFPVNNELKTVNELKIGDCFENDKETFSVPLKDKIDVVKLIIDNDLANEFYLSNCEDAIKVCKKYKIYYNSNKTVQIARIIDYLDEIDYDTAYLNMSRSSYKFNTIYPISKELMILLGHYIGNGSVRDYVISKSQEKMINQIKNALNTVFPNFTYAEYTKQNTYKIELNSKKLHQVLFDKLLNCRTFDKEKQLPNILFNVSNELKLAFLQGYFCDGNFKFKNDDGNYGEIVFNTSSEKLYKDMCLLLVSMNIDYSVSTEPAKTLNFSKNEPRIIHRKKRYRIRINNLIEIEKLKNVVVDHKSSKQFLETINSKHEEQYLRQRKPYIIKSITKLDEKRNVIDINIDSNDHLFITSHGIVSHNCAVGGRGDFDQHENFEEILKICTENDIVPNFTSSGLGFTEEIVELCKKYCGAVAISNYSHLEKVRMKREKTEEEMLKTRQYIGDKARIQEFVDDGWMNATPDENDENYDYLELTYENNNYTYHALKMLIDAGVKTNIHYVVGNNFIDEAMERLQNNDFIDGLNAVIFLLHKPIGLGKESNVLKVNDSRVKEFYHLIVKKHPYKVGLDSCNVPGIVNFAKNIPTECYDTCEGARHSCYIDSNMKMIPCSFDNQDLKWAVDLRTHSIKEAWDSEQFNDFRNHFRNSCKGCKDRHLCQGGCPIARSIVLCDKKEKDLK